MPTLTRRRLLSSIGVGSVLSLSFASIQEQPTQSNTVSDTKIVGHRGANGLAPQNSTEGILLAEEYGCDAVELDVQQTKDGTLILFHNPVFALSTDKGYGFVENTPYSEVKEYTVKGNEILTLEDGLEVVQETDMNLYLEMKSNDIFTDCYETVQEYGLTDRTTFLSLEEAHLDDIPPEVDTGFISSAPIERSVQNALELNCEFVGTHYSPIQQASFITEASNNGLKSILWSLVDTRESIEDALQSDADVIMVNRPDIVAQIKAEQ